MSLRDGRIENAALSRPYGAGVRVYDGLRSIYVYTCDVSETGLLRAADRGKVFRRNIVRRKGKRIIDIQHKKLIHFVFSKLYYSKIGCSGDVSGAG